MKSSNFAKKCAKQKYFSKTAKNEDLQAETDKIGRKRAVIYAEPENIFRLFTLKKQRVFP